MVNANIKSLRYNGLGKVTNMYIYDISKDKDNTNDRDDENN